MKYKSFSEWHQNLHPDVKETITWLGHYLRHPLQEIRQTPDWSWTKLIYVQGSIAAITGALAGLVEKKISWSIILGFFVSPLLTLITLTVATLFFYYCFQLFANRTIEPRKLFTVLLLANIPQFIFQVVAGIAPAISLIGMAFTGILLLVGFVENFKLDRKLVVRIISSLYALFFALWIWNKISSGKFESNWGEDRDIPEVRLGQ